MSAEALDAALTQHLAAIRRAAEGSPPGGGPEWDGLLRHYGIAPLEMQERQMIVQGMRMSRGAVPAEVRIVLVGLQKWADGELGRLHASGMANPHVAGALQQRIAMLVEHEEAAYERALGIAPSRPADPGPAAPAAPAAPSLASIFQNAHDTAKDVPWANQKFKQVANLTCVHCGGPQEQPMDFMCKYCRRPIAGAIKPTT